MKAINILSYILNVALIAALIYVLNGGFNKTHSDNTLEEIKQAIVEQERSRLPLTTQSLTSVNEVRIDSLVITNNIEPYSGYLATEWNYGPKKLKRTMFVEVSNIKCANKQISWETNWAAASLSLFLHN